MKKVITLLAAIALLSGCATEQPKNRAVYMLLDTSGTYTQELNKAQKIINYLLATLNSGDSLAVARIDSGSFSEKDIVSKVTFDLRPSVMSEQKRGFKRNIDDFVQGVKSSPYTDISGGVLQATEFLNETQADDKIILIFSDLKEDLIKGHVRNFSIPLVDIQVVALNVTKLRTDNIDPRDYLQRVSKWQERVIKGGGEWSVINDLERLDRVIAG